MKEVRSEFIKNIKRFAHDEEIVLDNSKSDWSKIYKVAYKGNVLNLAYNLYSKYYTNYAKKFYDIDFSNKVNLIKFTLATEVIDKLNNDNIFYCLIKGFTLSNEIYSNIYSRNYSDIDLIINIKDIKKVDNLLSNMGFIALTPIIEELYDNELELYELKYNMIKYANGEKVEINLEIKTTSSAIMRYNISNFFANIISTEIENIKFNVLDNYHSLIHLILNTYWNLEDEFSKVSLRDCIDLYIYVIKYNNILKDSKFKSLIDQYKIKNETFATLSMIYSIFKDDDINCLINELFDVNEILNLTINNYCGWKYNWNTNFEEILTDDELYSYEWYFRRAKKIYKNINFFNQTENEIILNDAYKNAKYNFYFDAFIKKNDDSIIITIDFKNSIIKNINTKILFFDLDYKIKEKSIEIIFNSDLEMKYNSNNIDSEILNFYDNKIEIKINLLSFNNYYTTKQMGFSFCAIKEFEKDTFFALLNDEKNFENSIVNIINI